MELGKEGGELALVFLDARVETLDLRPAALLVVAELLGQQLAARLPASVTLGGNALRLGVHPVANGRDIRFRSLAKLLPLLGRASAQCLDRLVDGLPQG